METREAESGPAEFEFEFQSEIRYDDDALRTEAGRQLLALREGHTDITGASVVVEEVSRDTTPNTYRARVVVYMRPDFVAATEKNDSAEGALKGALDAITRQVREKRDKLRTQWKQP